MAVVTGASGGIGNAIELSHTNIKISCIEPGLVETGLHRDWEVKPQELLGITTALAGGYSGSGYGYSPLTRLCENS